MIKLFSLLSALSFLTGCTLDNVAFVHQSSLETRARGVSLLDSGRAAQIGMIGNTCQVDIESGMIGADFDVAIGEEDKVLDSNENSTLVIGNSGNNIFILNNDWNGTTTTTYVDNVQDALFFQDGLVAIVQNNDCSINWFNNTGDLDSHSIIPCDQESFVVDSSSTAYISTGSELIIASPENTFLVESDSNLSAFDSTQNILYVAQRNNNIVSALNPEGILIWTTTLNLPVVSLDDMGVEGAVAIMTGGDTLGEIIILDGATGHSKSSFPTPGVAEEIKVSQNGQTLAAILDDQIHFYKLISLQ